MSAHVALHLELSYEEDGYRRTFLEREILLPGVPREGEYVSLTEGGWSEPVRNVWWNTVSPAGAVTCELGSRTYIPINSASFPDWRKQDPADELVALGWKKLS